MRRTAARATLCILAVLPLGVARATDLLPALARAPLCRDDAPECAAEGSGAARGALVRLPPGAARRLHLRLPRAGRLELDVARAAAVLSVGVRTDERGARELARVSEAVEPGVFQTVSIDLAPYGGLVAELTLRADPGPADASFSQGVLVRRAVLERAAGRPAPVRTPPVAPGAAPPNVVLYVIDTLRADHLGCYGYDRPTSPRIDQLARSGIVYDRTLAHSSWTLPSVASILTGLTPPAHGAVTHETAIRPGVSTLAETLRARGYLTAAFVTNYLGSDVFGLGRGFDTFRFYRERGDVRPAVYLRSDALHRRIRRWLARGVREPFLLYVHATDPHFPYVPPRRYARPFVSAADTRRASAATEAARPLHNGRDEWGLRPAPLPPDDATVLRDLYDGEIRLADDWFGRTLDALADHGLLDRTLVVLTSDHGEEFLEHGGVAHGQTLYDEALHVPLILRLPDGRRAGERVATIAQHVDILPTVLEVAGLPRPEGVPGRSLLDATPEPAPEAYCSLRLGPFALDALASDDWKVIRDRNRPAGERFQVYATDRDPQERADVAAARPVLLDYGRDRLHEVAAPRPPGPRVPDERLDRLRALGYVGD